jgi:hypothetical protein
LYRGIGNESCILKPELAKKTKNAHMKKDLLLCTELTAMLKVNADNAMSYLDSVAMLLTVCKFADPKVANRVEKEIRDEVASLALEHGRLTGAGDGDIQAIHETGQLSKLVSSLKWEHWVSYTSSPLLFLFINKEPIDVVSRDFPTKFVVYYRSCSSDLQLLIRKAMTERYPS